MARAICIAVGGSGELPATNLAAAIALAVAGPGALSLDARSGRKLPAGLVALITLGAAASSAASIGQLLRATRQGAAPEA